MLHALSIILTILSEMYNYEAPHYDIFTLPLLFPPSYVETFSTAPRFQTPSIPVLPLN